MALRKRGIVVGVGSIGRRHARLLRERGDLDVAYCETSDETLAAARREVGEATTYRTFTDALDAAPDFVVIATPHDLHREQTVAALERGVPVLCEKPMSDRLCDAVAMQEAARRTGTLLSVGFMLRFNPGLLRIKRLIAEGVLGTVLSANCRVGSYITLVNSRSRYQARVYGSLLLDYAHQPDILSWLLGRTPRGVYCAGAHGGALQFSSNPNMLSIVCDYDDPLVATMLLNYVQMPERNDCEIIGDRSWVSLDMKTGELRLGSREDESIRIQHLPIERDDLYREEHRVFLDAIEGKGSPSSPPDDAIVSMRIIDAARSSLERKARIELLPT